MSKYFTKRIKLKILNTMLEVYITNKYTHSNINRSIHLHEHGLCFLTNTICDELYYNTIISYNYSNKILNIINQYSTNIYYKGTGYWFPTSLIWDDEHPFNPNDRINILKQIINDIQNK